MRHSAFSIGVFAEAELGFESLLNQSVVYCGIALIWCIELEGFGLKHKLFKWVTGILL